MNQEGSQPHFIIAVAPEVVQREKEKARALRKTQWWQRQIGKGVCHYCGDPFPPKELTMDHIVPLIRGGRSTRGNVAAACKNCNNKKKYLLPIEWEDYLRSLSAPTASGTAVSHAQVCREDDHGRM
jgi:5-methylcytosine-specific restriction endonuclease McrA